MWQTSILMSGLARELRKDSGFWCVKAALPHLASVSFQAHMPLLAFYWRNLQFGATPANTRVSIVFPLALSGLCFLLVFIF